MKGTPVTYDAGTERRQDRRKEAPAFVYVDRDDKIVERNDPAMIRKLNLEDARELGILKDGVEASEEIASESDEETPVENEGGEAEPTRRRNARPAA